MGFKYCHFDDDDDDDDDDDWLYHSFLNTRVVEGSQSLTE